MIINDYKLYLAFYDLKFVTRNTNSQVHCLASPCSIEYSHGGLKNEKLSKYINLSLCDSVKFITL
jgi:hypothetical protein